MKGITVDVLTAVVRKVITEEVNTRIDKLDAKVDRLDAKIDRVDEKLSRAIDKLDDRLTRVEKGQQSLRDAVIVLGDRLPSPGFFTAHRKPENPVLKMLTVSEPEVEYTTNKETPASP